MEMKEPLGYDPYDMTELNVFEEHPELFYVPDSDPLVLTVRGAAFLKPRLALVGIELGRVTSIQALGQALQAWSEEEVLRVVTRIEDRAQATHAPSAEKVLLATFRMDIDEAEKQLKRLQHLRRSQIRPVS